MELGDLDKSWNLVTDYLLHHQAPVSQDVFRQAVQVLENQQMTNVIEPWFFEVVQQQLRSQVAALFWEHFDLPVPDDQVISYMKSVFDAMYLRLSTYWSSLDRLDILHSLLDSKQAGQRDRDSSRQKLVLIFKAILFPLCPHSTKYFQHAIHKFYSKAFKAFDAITKSASLDLDTSDAESLSCEGCNMEKDACCCEEIMSAFHHLNHQLRDLGLLDRLCGEVVSTLIHQRVVQHVEHTCKGNLETQYLGPLENWLGTKVVGWLELLYGSPQESTSSHDSQKRIQDHRDRLLHYMYDIYARVHIQQMFTIIIEYPDSTPALLDLKECLEKTSLRSLLVQSLRQELQTRLLHPGVNTSDILTAYINAIRALRVLDPTGVLLDLVCEPVRRYLRSREDTVRCVVSNLTEDSSSELSEELVKNRAVVHDDSCHSDDDTEDWENWQPDPVDADPAKSSGSRRSADIISMLINIYGSKELFVNEYRTILADRILTHFNYDTEKEIRYLELLKVKFGEAQLHYCEVMLKDVADSRRINMHIVDQRERRAQAAREERARAGEAEPENNESLQDFPLNSLILSAEFWPTFREEKLKLPTFMDKHMANYTKGFESLKGNRTLCWKPHLGQVLLEIEHKGKTLELAVSPVHATIIWYFQENSKWSVDELSSIIQMPSHALRRKITFWQSHGLLKEQSPDVFVLVEEVKSRSHDTVVMEEEEVESAMATAQDKKEEELNVIWQYVVGMLTNLESLPLERIHSMLKMFAMQGPGSDCSVHQLKAFLDKKVKDQKLVFSGGVYRLPKPGS